MKKQFLTLALLATVAVGGAFAGNSVRTKRPGAPFDASAPCSTALKECSDIVSTICTIEIENQTVQLFDNTSDSGTCTVPLYTCP